VSVCFFLNTVYRRENIGNDDKSVYKMCTAVFDCCDGVYRLVKCADKLCCIVFLSDVGVWLSSV